MYKFNTRIQMEPPDLVLMPSQIHHSPEVMILFYVEYLMPVPDLVVKVSLNSLIPESPLTKTRFNRSARHILIEH
jgi:hypothetical protein